jgi:hypothetical protein
MVEYTKNIHCGEVIIKIEKNNGKYKINARIKKFGNCSAYMFISKVIEDELNSGKEVKEVINKLKNYSCKLGNSGCIEEIGKCIEEFSKGK